MSAECVPKTIKKWVSLIVILLPQQGGLLNKIIFSLSGTYTEYRTRPAVICDANLDELFLWKLRFPDEGSWQFDGRNSAIYFYEEAEFQEAEDFADSLRDNIGVSRMVMAEVTFGRRVDLEKAATLLARHPTYFGFPKGAPEDLLLQM